MILPDVTNSIWSGLFFPYASTFLVQHHVTATCHLVYMCPNLKLFFLKKPFQEIHFLDVGKEVLLMVKWALPLFV